jgi:hypothetical protein
MQFIGLVRYTLEKPWLAMIMAGRVDDQARSTWAPSCACSRDPGEKCGLA